MIIYRFLRLGLLSVLCWIVHADFGTTSNDWDYFVFTVSWPPTVCKDKYGNCSGIDLPKNWTIHGLWPSISNGSGLFSCPKASGAKFNISILQPILKSLERYWPSLLGEKDDYFWGHEWEKHGQCVNTTFIPHDQLKYFNAGLNLRQRYDFTRILTSANITQSNSTMSSVADMLDALYKGLGKRVLLFCDMIKISKHDERRYVSELRICFDKDFELIDCHWTVPGYHNQQLMYNPTNCSDEAYWPGFDTLDTQKKYDEDRPLKFNPARFVFGHDIL